MGNSQDKDEELRVLRRGWAHKHVKENPQPMTRIEIRMQGIKAESRATVALYDVPPPMGIQAEEVTEVGNVAIRRAQEHCKELGYSKVLGVWFNGKVWEAKFQV